MLDSLLGFILMLLGLQTPPAVKGDSIATPSASVATSGGSTATTSTKILERRQLLLNYIDAVTKQKETFLKDVQTQREVAQRERTGKLSKFQANSGRITNVEKKVIVERVENNLTTINTNRTIALTNQLTTMRAILMRIAEKAGKTEKDTTKLLTLITDAEKKLSIAETALITQTGKTYSITITNGEKNLKSDATSARVSLSNDLKSIQDRVKSARDNILSAVKELGILFGETI